jgi:serine/threonine protein kinase
MSVNAELANWGELPTNAAEETLAELVHEALRTLRRTGQQDPTLLLPGNPRAQDPSSQSLFQTMFWVEDLALGIRQPQSAGDAAQASLPDPFPGEFRVRDLVAEGAFGKVWLADDLHILGRRVALKMLKPASQTGIEVMAALRNEAHLLDSVRHPNVVRIHAVRQSGDHCYLVLDYVAGGSLAARLHKETCLSWQSACCYVSDVGEALLEIHARGIVHGDIKPANILWDSEKDEAVLTDFGVACRLAEPGALAGTIPYLPPEAFDGPVSAAHDVFALAATLFELVTGAVPFRARNAREHIAAVRKGLPTPDVRCGTLPPAVEQILRTGLAADPPGRASLQEFVLQLRGTLNRLLADQIGGPAAVPSKPAPVDLCLLVRRDERDRKYLPVQALPQQSAALPPVPGQVRLRTGDRIRIHARVNRPGYVTILNIGPSGNLHLLWPEPGVSPVWVGADQPVEVPSVEVTLPPGRERLLAFWSLTPLPLNQALRLAEGAGCDVSRPYLATRDLKRVEESVRQLRRDDWHAVVLELEHDD